MSTKTEEISSQTELKVHRVRFFNAELSSINSMCLDEESQLLAVMRRRVYKYKKGHSDSWSKIEIWNFNDKAPFIQQIITEDGDNPCLLEAVVWAKDRRLLSCGLNAYINEYDLNNSCIKRSYAVTSGPSWCMSIDKTKTMIAVGTEEGYICVFRVGDEQIEFEKTMDRHEKRILCINWYQSHDDNLLLIGGSINFIKIWNYNTGQCIDFIKVGADDSVVWCLTVLDDFTIISGDSNGSTSFWDGNTSTLICTHRTHKADVLCICTNNDQSVVYSSGVDPIVALFSMKSDKLKRWNNTFKLHLHSHDVRSLTCAKPNWLISGGIDSYLLKSCYPNTQLRYAPNFTSHVHFKNDKILLQYDHFIEIWRLGKEDDDLKYSNLMSNILPLSDIPIKLIELKSKKFIVASALSNKWISYSTADGIKLLHWNDMELTKVKVLYESISNANEILFINDDFIAINCGTKIHVLKLDPMGAVLQHCFNYDFRVNSMIASDKFIAILTENKSVLMYDMNWNMITNITLTSLPSVYAINPFKDDGELWIAYANRQLIQYDIKEKRIKKSFNINECISESDNRSLDQFWSINQIGFANDAVLFTDDNLLYKLHIFNSKVTKCDKYRHIIKLGNTEVNGELIIIELTSEMLFSKLPAPFAKKKFRA